MSEENVELVRHAVAHWNHGDRRDMSLFHPEIEWLPMRSSTEGAYHGHAGMEMFVADTERGFETFELRLEELRAVGDRVVAWGCVHFRARQSGVDMDQPIGGVIEFRDGKIIRWEDFGSKDEALEAAGLKE